jgi:hypothetical protein
LHYFGWGQKRCAETYYFFAPLLLGAFALNPFTAQMFAELQLTRLEVA